MYFYIRHFILFLGLLLINTSMSTAQTDSKVKQKSIVEERINTEKEVTKLFAHHQMEAYIGAMRFRQMMLKKVLEDFKDSKNKKALEEYRRQLKKTNIIIKSLKEADQAEYDLFVNGAKIEVELYSADSPFSEQIYVVNITLDFARWDFEKGKLSDLSKLKSVHTVNFIDMPSEKITEALKSFKLSAGIEKIKVVGKIDKYALISISKLVDLKELDLTKAEFDKEHLKPVRSISTLKKLQLPPKQGDKKVDKKSESLDRPRL